MEENGGSASPRRSPCAAPVVGWLLSRSQRRQPPAMDRRRARAASVARFTAASFARQPRHPPEIHVFCRRLAPSVERSHPRRTQQQRGGIASFSLSQTCSGRCRSSCCRSSFPAPLQPWSLPPHQLPRGNLGKFHSISFFGFISKDLIFDLKVWCVTCRW